MLSLYKWEKLMEYNRLAPTYFVARYSDNVVMYINAEMIKGEVKNGGRKVVRQGSYSDKELCIYFDKSSMKVLD